MLSLRIWSSSNVRAWGSNLKTNYGFWRPLVNLLMIKILTIPLILLIKMYRTTFSFFFLNLPFLFIFKTLISWLKEMFSTVG